MDNSCHHHGCCGCNTKGVNRREFLATASGLATGITLFSNVSHAKEVFNKPSLTYSTNDIHKKTLTVQPVLVYQLYERREATSWRPWGGLHTSQDVNNEIHRIQTELRTLQARAEFPLQFRQVLHVTNGEQATKARETDADVLLIYAASGWDLEKLVSEKRFNLMFVRHKSGPVYLWYEIAHPWFLRKAVDEYGQPGMDTNDVIVDNYDDILWRLRALFALKNTFNSRIVAIGGAGGWGYGGQKAPEIAKQIWNLEICNVSYEELGKRIQLANEDTSLINQTKEAARKYIKTSGVKTQTDFGYIERAFLLKRIFDDLMKEYDAPAITVNECMTTIIPMAKTTACLTLTLINDEGKLAFCESDFVVIPSGILLHNIAGTPVFLQDPTYPHHGVVTLAHCTAPRLMDGKRLEKVQLLTHFESDYGAAPKVEMRVGQIVTVLDPDFASERWIGFRGKIIDNPFLDICRTQIDVEIEGDWAKLVQEMRGFHWMLSYGDYLKEVGYALQKSGVGWYNLTRDTTREV